MQISWLGHSCFKIETKGDNDTVTLVIDPFEDSLGIKMSSCKADVVLVTHDHTDHNNIAAIKSEPFVIKGAGEYEVKKIVVYGVPTFHDDTKGIERGTNTCFRIDAEGLSIAHLGDLGHTLTDEQLELLEGVDVLMIPVGGKYTLDAKQASEVVSQIEPRLVLPMHFKYPGVRAELDGVEVFLKELGTKKQDNIDKLKINKKDLINEDTQVVLLNVS
ncbi:MAG: MBL fold metallo-hydrolase [Patescibacteria group bacterium]